MGLLSMPWHYSHTGQAKRKINKAVEKVTCAGLMDKNVSTPEIEWLEPAIRKEISLSGAASLGVMSTHCWNMFGSNCFLYRFEFPVKPRDSKLLKTVGFIQGIYDDGFLWQFQPGLLVSWSLVSLKWCSCFHLHAEQTQQVKNENVPGNKLQRRSKH